MDKNKKFFETDSFKQTKAEWDAKLAASGFDDLEKPDEKVGFCRRQIFTAKKNQYDGGLNYYEHCQLILREFPFKRDLDRVVFELHASGKAEREIVTWLKENASKPEHEHLRLKALKKTGVHQIIERIKEDFGRL